MYKGFNLHKMGISKMLTRLSVLICAIITIAASVASARDFSYYVTIEDSTYTIVSDAIDSLVAIVPLESEMTTIVSDCIDDEIPPEDLTPTCQIYHLVDGYTIDSALTELDNNPQVGLALPVCLDDANQLKYVTEEITVNVANNFQVDEVINDLENNYYCEVIDQGGFFGVWIDGSYYTLPDNDGYTQLLIRMTHDTKVNTDFDDPFALSRHFFTDVDDIAGAAPNFRGPLNQACFVDTTETLEFQGGGKGEPEEDPYRVHQWYLDSIFYDGAVNLLGEPQNEVTYIVLGAAFDTIHEDLGEDIIATYDACGVDGNTPDLDVSPPSGDTIDEYRKSFWGIGTNIIGLLAAQSFNGIGIQGMAPHSRFILIKIVDDERGYYSMWGLWRAFQYIAIASAADLCDIAVIQAYLEPSDPLNASLETIHKYNGVPFAPCSDKGGDMPFPATNPNVVSVSALNKYGYPEYISGNKVPDFGAPGKDIFTTDRPGRLGSNPGMGSGIGDEAYFDDLDGAGAAATIAAGIAARVFSAIPELKGVYTYSHPYGHPLNQIRQVLRRSTSDYDGSSEPLTGFGKVNAFRAAAMVAGGDPDGSKQTDIDDVVYLIEYIFGGGPAPVPYLFTGDADCSGDVDIDDVVFLIDYIFGGGPDPHLKCEKHLEYLDAM